jgi:hypothetical protein
VILAVLRSEVRLTRPKPQHYIVGTSFSGLAPFTPNAYLNPYQGSDLDWKLIVGDESGIILESPRVDCTENEIVPGGTLSVGSY